MQTLGCFDGNHGKIFIIEERANGSRRYYEGGAFQSHASRTGESCFTYVHLMNAVLQPARNVLLLGCAGGTLATMLYRQGKKVTVVDRNPLSFQLAREYFWMPSEIRCVIADFKDFVADTTEGFEAIAIDVGGPGFKFVTEFGDTTCRALRGRLAGRGRIAMNVLIEHGMDLFPDVAGNRLAGSDLNTWVIDETVREPERNAVIACVPESELQLRWETLPDAVAAAAPGWFVRRSHLEHKRGPAPLRACYRTIGGVRWLHWCNVLGDESKQAVAQSKAAGLRIALRKHRDGYLQSFVHPDDFESLRRENRFGETAKVGGGE
jgi:SAM-dependent methyltransferase